MRVIEMANRSELRLGRAQKHRATPSFRNSRDLGALCEQIHRLWKDHVRTIVLAMPIQRMWEGCNRRYHFNAIFPQERVLEDAWYAVPAADRRQFRPVVGVDVDHIELPEKFLEHSGHYPECERGEEVL